MTGALGLTPGQAVLVVASHPDDETLGWPHKEQALGCYASQLRGGGHPRCAEQIRMLDAAAGGSLGWTAAESFVGCRLTF